MDWIDNSKSKLMYIILGLRYNKKGTKLKSTD